MYNTTTLEVWDKPRKNNGQKRTFRNWDGKTCRCDVKLPGSIQSSCIDICHRLRMALPELAHHRHRWSFLQMWRVGSSAGLLEGVFKDWGIGCGPIPQQWQNLKLIIERKGGHILYIIFIYIYIYTHLNHISSCKKSLPNPRCETLPTGLGNTLLIIVTLLVLSHGFGVWAYNLQFLWLLECVVWCLTIGKLCGIDTTRFPTVESRSR